MKLPIRETIDLKEFKFPPTPQTPRLARRYLNWTPGSGFDSIQLSSPTALNKRYGRRTHVDSYSRRRRSRIRRADQPKARAVDDVSSNADRRKREVVKRRLFAGGSSHNTGAISTRDSVTESGKPAEEAVEDEQSQPLSEIGQQDVQEGEGPALAEEVQNHQEPLIRQPLAEGPSSRNSLREWHHKSCRDAEPSHIHTGNATAKRAHGTAIASEPNVSAISPYAAYLHPPSSALQDPPIHDTREDIHISTRSGIAFFPYRAYLHPPSSTLQEAAMSGTEVDIADQDLGEETESSQGSSSESTSDEEDRESMHQEKKEPEIADQNPTNATKSRQNSSSETTSDEEENWETILETDDDMNNGRSTPDDEDMLDNLEKQQHPPPTQSGISTPH